MKTENSAAIKERDLKLIAAFCNGDESAGECLFKFYQGEVFRVCAQILRDPVQADDATQEVFFKVLVQKKIKKFRGDSLLSTWLTAVAKNTCWQMFRKSKVLYHRELPIHPTLDPMDYQPNPEQVFAKNEHSEQVHALLECVPVKFRAALQLVFIEGKTHEEAAAMLHIPLVTLNVHIFRGKIKLCAVCRRHFVLTGEVLLEAA